MTSMASDSAFSRLSQRQTKASIGQQIGFEQSLSTFVNRGTVQKRPTGRKMTTDKRMSLLDELEEAEQTYPEHREGGAIQDSDEDLLQELLESAMLPSSTLEPTSTVAPKQKQTSTARKTVTPRKAQVKPVATSKHKPNVAEAGAGSIQSVSNSRQSVFDRLYRQETKASIGQQVDSVRQKTLLRMQSNRKSEPPAATKKVFKARTIVSADTTVGTVTTCSSSTVGGHDVSREKSPFTTPKRNRPWNQLPSGAYRTKTRTPERTPETVLAGGSDDSSASTVSSLVDTNHSPTERNADLDFLFLPKASSTTTHVPWKMALTRKATDDEEKEEPFASDLEPLYLRSMANTLYEFASGNTGETEVATELVTALFRRDFDSGKYWTEEAAEAIPTEDDGVYFAEKAAVKSIDHGRTTTKTISSACIRFDRTNRMVIVQDYHHGDISS